jgi:CheY-like chemotaxis protein/anti-sigma regulatory factor (Ser/Thr protein kinase)
MKILIVEDEPDLRETLTDLLEMNGYEVLCAGDGVQGVQLAAQNPDFILCDVAMPNLDGYGVLAAVKQIPGVRDVPFVFLTARAERAEQREGMALGADDYITKPFRERDILDAIAARTGRHRGMREQVRQLAQQHHREIHAQWSHELLTPLNAVVGCLDLLDLDLETLSAAELRELLATIREGVERQERLARKLIRYFELEQLLQAHPSPKPGRSQADQAAGSGATQAAQRQARGGDLSLALEPGTVAVRGEFLTYAVGEAVENACKFSSAGNPVTVTGKNLEGRYRIEISDQGPGLTDEQRVQIGAFAQFGRRQREQQGLGLGLAIARATARLAGGHLQLEAGAGSRGLTVVFDLPAGDPG